MGKLNRKKAKKIIAAAVVLLIILLAAFFVPAEDVIQLVRYEFSAKDSLSVILKQVNPSVAALSAEPSNRLYLTAEVRNKEGRPVPMADIDFSTDIGVISPYNNRTDKDGSILAAYIPPDSTEIPFNEEKKRVSISASISGTDIESSIQFNLVKPPVVLVHGYKSTGAVFDNMSEFIESKGFTAVSAEYRSENGVAASAREINRFLEDTKRKFLSRGIKVNRFDVITHSMGGLVIRYYTCSREYIPKDDVRKIIFLSVPHKGSPLAPIGVPYYGDKGIEDLVPQSDLIVNTLPSMINKGLNSRIQVGSMIGQYDEVVSLESASLEEWGIKTYVFNVGENNLTVDNLLSGTIIESANHKNVLNNKKVFEKIEEMLKSPLPYPQKR